MSPWRGAMSFAVAIFSPWDWGVIYGITSSSSITSIVADSSTAGSGSGSGSGSFYGSSSVGMSIVTSFSYGSRLSILADSTVTA